MSEIEQLRARIVAAHARVDAAVAGMDAVALETQPAVGVWSPRDVVGHLADWQLEMLAAARHIIGGEKPRGQPIRDGEGFNQTRAAVRGADPWDLTTRDLDAARDATLAFIAELTPQQLNAVGPYPWGAVGKLRDLIEEMAAHLDEHAAQLESWRLRRAGARVE